MSGKIQEALVVLENECNCLRKEYVDSFNYVHSKLDYEGAVMLNRCEELSTQIFELTEAINKLSN